MKSHKNRLDKLSKQLGPGEDDEVIVIRLGWEGEMWPPITYRRSADDRLIFPFTQVIKTLQRGQYSGEEITVRWPHEDELDAESLI